MRLLAHDGPRPASGGGCSPCSPPTAATSAPCRAPPRPAPIGAEGGRLRPKGRPRQRGRGALPRPPEGHDRQRRSSLSAQQRRPARGAPAGRRSQRRAGAAPQALSTSAPPSPRGRRRRQRHRRSGLRHQPRPRDHRRSRDAGRHPLPTPAPSRPSPKAPISHDTALCKAGNRIERRFNKLEPCRRFATRHHHRTAHFPASPHLASAIIAMR